MRRSTQIGAIALKELLHIWRDKRSMLILFALPALIVSIFGFVLSFEIKEVGVAALIQGNRAEAQRLLARFDASDQFHVVGSVSSPDQIANLLSTERVKMVVVFPESFGSFRRPDSTLHLFIDASYTRVATALESAAKQIVQQYGYEEQPGFVAFSGKESATVHFLYNPELKREAMPIPGLMMIIFLLVSSVMFSISVIRERENGTARLLVLAPLNNARWVVAKAIPYLGIAIFHIGSVWLLSYLLFGVSIAGSSALFFALCLLFSVNAMAFGLLIASWVNRQLEALIICWLFLFIPNLFLSGFIFPLQSMPDLLRGVAAFMPGTAFMEGYRGIVFRGTGFEVNLRYFLLLALPLFPLARLAFWGISTRYAQR